MTIPRDEALDGTLALMREGYGFIWNRCRRHRTDAFRTRILGKRTVCIHGRDAAELFYDEAKLQRHGALPRRVITSLFGNKAVHTLDDAAHRQRKAAFLRLMSPASLQELMTRTAAEWRLAIRRWASMDEVILFEEAQQVLTRATCAWAGLPLDERDVQRRARDFGLMVDAFGGVGPRLWRGKLARIRTQRWVAKAIEDVRAGGFALPGSALEVMAAHEDARGRLPTKVAAVELINVIRPTVAISWYIAFAAHALHTHPEAREAVAREPLGEGAGEYAERFMQEVRRFYPFTPYLGARVRKPFSWKGHRFEPGTLVLLDVYGTDHDPRLWHVPDEFRPSRFSAWQGDAFTLIPQGGGSRTTGHRCPGEWITMHNTALALHFLTRCMDYTLKPGQDLRIDLTRMPTRPASGVILRGVRPRAALDGPAPPLPSTTATRDATAPSPASLMPATTG